MKTTKVELQRALDAAARFNELPLVYMSTRDTELIRAREGFLPVCQYGRGLLPLRNELGTNGKVRYLYRGAGA